MVFTERPNRVPGIPRAESVLTPRPACLLDVLLPGEAREIAQVSVFDSNPGPVHGHEYVKLNVGARGKGLLYGAGKPGHAAGAMAESGAWDHDCHDSAKGSVRNLQVEHVTREIGNDGIWRREVYPGACEGEELRDGITRRERSVHVLQRGYQRQRLGVRRPVRDSLGVGAQEAQHARVEVGIRDRGGEHVILGGRQQRGADGGGTARGHDSPRGPGHAGRGRW